MIWYMGLDKNNIPNGWDTEPWGNAIEVSQEIRDIHVAHPEYYWDGNTLVSPPIPAPYVPTQQDIINSLTIAVQAHLDNKARERNYDGILSMCTYVTSTNPKFAAEGQAGVEWRDDVWEYCYQVLRGCELGTRNIPTVDELISELPAFTWPI